jgi:hypothetical protein
MSRPRSVKVNVYPNDPEETHLVVQRIKQIEGTTIEAKSYLAGKQNQIKFVICPTLKRHLGVPFRPIF